MFRLGDFYEMFFDDAKTASKELDLVLTGRDCGQEERAPMCGVPFHSADGYIAKLVSKGYKVAVCEQLEDPKTAKGIVKRDVIRVITAGTVIESSMLDETKNNYLCSCCLLFDGLGLCFVDVSTGELYLTEFSENYDIPWKISTITAVSPLSAVPGTVITIQGENLGSDLVSSTGITIGTEICTIVSQSATSITIIAPSFQTSEELDVVVLNLHNRKFVFEKKFVPIQE